MAIVQSINNVYQFREAFRLNPFEFRAGLKRVQVSIDELKGWVLIPLNSGLA